MLEAEALRLNYIELYNALLAFHYEDTCVNSKIIQYVGALNSKGYKKRPKLSELYIKLFGTLFEDAHNSLADIKATMKCYFECVKLGLIDQYE